MYAVTRGFCALVLVLAAVGCGGGREKAEARAFLAAYGAIDHREQPADRERHIQALEAVVITTPTIAHTRDECVKAHRALLDSERAQENAAQSLDAALKLTDGAAPMAPERTAAIQAVIGAAEKALSEAKRRFSTCETEARDLSLRYGQR